MRRLVAAVLLAALLAPALAAAAPRPRTTLIAVENEVMCVSCKIPLTLAESPEADRERAFIRTLVAQGKTKQQVLDAMKTEYGSRVLSTPSTSGVDLSAWVVPGGAVLVLLGAGVLAYPRWRRRGEAARRAGPAAAGPALAAADAARLDDELARFDA